MEKTNKLNESKCPWDFTDLQCLQARVDEFAEINRIKNEQAKIDNRYNCRDISLLSEHNKICILEEYLNGKFIIMNGCNKHYLDRYRVIEWRYVPHYNITSLLVEVIVNDSIIGQEEHFIHGTFDNIETEYNKSEFVYLINCKSKI